MPTSGAAPTKGPRTPCVTGTPPAADCGSSPLSRLATDCQARCSGLHADLPRPTPDCPRHELRPLSERIERGTPAHREQPGQGVDRASARIPRPTFTARRAKRSSDRASPTDHDKDHDGANQRRTIRVHAVEPDFRKDCRKRSEDGRKEGPGEPVGSHLSGRCRWSGTLSVGS